MPIACLLPDGRVKHVHAIAHVLPDASGNREFVGAVTDITERKTAEDGDSATRSELRNVVDTFLRLCGVRWSMAPTHTLTSDLRSTWGRRRNSRPDQGAQSTSSPR